MSVFPSTAGCERVHPQAAGLAGGRLPDEGRRRQVTILSLSRGHCLKIGQKVDKCLLVV